MRMLTSAAAVLAVVALPALAQTTPPTAPAPSAAPASPVTAAPPSASTTSKAVQGAPVAGANSFSESQAQARIEARGFTNVTGLKKDDQGVWRGQATKDGKSVSVALDYQGNVTAD